MIRLSAFKNRSIAIFGLGGSGLAAAQALQAGGAQVSVWDDNASARDMALSHELDVVDLSQADWKRFDSLVVAPGVPLTHPKPHWVVAAAHAVGVEVIGDIELFLRQRVLDAPYAPFIAITGTNGKSTTTALTAHVLRGLGCQVSMGGNIGTAILSLEPAEDGRAHVVELSSYQIDLTPSLVPTVGVLLNVTPDHLDRHGTIEHYASVKARLVQGAQRACICVDDPRTKAIAESIEPADRLYAFTTGKGASVVPRGYAIASSLFVHTIKDGIGESAQIADLANVASLRGTHNVENALAAVMVVRALADHAEGSDPDFARQLWRPSRISDGLITFPGLAHRLQQVATLGSVRFVNDSKATNAESAEKALSSFDQDIYWIAGGRAKEGGIASLKPLLGRVAKAYLIGEAAEAFAQTLDGRAPYEIAGTLGQAVANAVRDAQNANAQAPVILFSPACASFDQYKNFEVRGDHFVELVCKVPDVELSGGLG